VEFSQDGATLVSSNDNETLSLDVATGARKDKVAGQFVFTKDTNGRYIVTLRSMPQKQQRRRTHRPGPAVARPQAGVDLLGDRTLDEDDARASDDYARDTSMSSARGGFGGFGGRRPVRTPSPSLAASGGAARWHDARDRSEHDDCGRYTTWKKADFPTDDALRQCKVKRHEDLPRHIYLLFDILGLHFRWLLTRMGVGSKLVSSEELAVDDNKERAWMAVYANDRDVIVIRTRIEVAQNLFSPI
jgi:hypothetical protein